MQKNLLINIKYQNIPVVFTNYDYHSKKSLLLNIPENNYIIFISLLPKEQSHRIIGYMKVRRTYVDENTSRAMRFGKYTAEGYPNETKQINKLYISDVADVIERNLKGKNGVLTKKSVGQSTQGPTHLSKNDVLTILGKAEIKDDDELSLIRDQLQHNDTRLDDYVEVKSDKLLEANLEDFTISQISKIEDGLKVVGRQVATDIGRIDLLCVDKCDNYVVIELKRGKIGDEVVGQISRYMGWIAKHKTHNIQKVRGIIITGVEDEKLNYAIEANPRITLKTYSLSFK